MRLSEGIRLGSMLRPRQAFYMMFDEERNATCALGAAAEAVGILDLTVRNGYTGKAPAAWKAFVSRDTACPIDCGYDSDRLDEVIIHLNNQHRWTRERIADWVEGIENSVASAPQSVGAVDPVVASQHEPTTRV